MNLIKTQMLVVITSGFKFQIWLYYLVAFRSFIVKCLGLNLLGEGKSRKAILTHIIVKRHLGASSKETSSTYLNICPCTDWVTQTLCTADVNLGVNNHYHSCCSMAGLFVPCSYQYHSLSIPSLIIFNSTGGSRLNN